MHRSVTLAVVALGLAAAFTAASSATGQVPSTGTTPVELVEPAGSGRRTALGLELSFLVPRGDFSPGSELSVGYGLRGALGLDPRGMFDLGAAFRSVAHDSHEYSDTLEVRNMLRTLSLSARFAIPLRFVRPYVGGSVGAAYFGTEAWVERCCNDDGEYEWELDGFDAVTFQPTASTRVGVLVDLGGQGRGQPVLALDLGVENHHGRRAAYQVGGRGEMRRSGTSYRVYSLGLTVGVR